MQRNEDVRKIRRDRLLHHGLPIMLRDLIVGGDLLVDLKDQLPTHIKNVGGLHKLLVLLIRRLLLKQVVRNMLIEHLGVPFLQILLVGDLPVQILLKRLPLLEYGVGVVGYFIQLLEGGQ